MPHRPGLHSWPLSGKPSHTVGSQKKRVSKRDVQGEKRRPGPGCKQRTSQVICRSPGSLFSGSRRRDQGATEQRAQSHALQGAGVPPPEGRGLGDEESKRLTSKSEQKSPSSRPPEVRRQEILTPSPSSLALLPAPGNPGAVFQRPPGRRQSPSGRCAWVGVGPGEGSARTLRVSLGGPR